MNASTPIRRHVRAVHALGAALLLSMGCAHAARIEGVWKANVTIFDCNTKQVLRTFQGLQVFHAGGTLTDTNSTDPASRGPGMGVWRKVARGQFATQFTSMSFSGGVYTGYAVANRQVTLGPDGNTATGSTHSEIYDANGNLITTTCGEDDSVRFLE